MCRAVVNGQNMSKTGVNIRIVVELVQETDQVPVRQPVCCMDVERLESLRSETFVLTHTQGIVLA